MAVLSTVNFKVDPLKWELFTNLYPQRASKMLRDYVERMVSNVDFASDTQDVEMLQEKLNEYLTTEKEAQIKKESVLAKIEELKERKEEEESYILTQEEEAWIKEYGVTIVENRGFQESFKSFQNVFKRFTFPRPKFEEHIKKAMEKKKK